MDKALPTSFCPNCKCKLDRATCFSNKGVAPAPGDFTVCIQCATVLVFTQYLHLRRPTEDDWRTLPTKVANELTKLQFAVMATHSQRV